MLNKPYQKALVPTMGALHAGHAALIKRAAAIAQQVVVSIFVNPLQFGVGEDYTRYLRSLEADTALALANGAHHIYAPTPEQMYKQGFACSVQVGDMGTVLEGAARPTHFNGMATVVLKLLQQQQPNVLLLGEKDYQQLRIVQRMVEDFDMAVHIESVPIVRDADGLALSSRNAYLSPQSRAVAPALYAALGRVQQGQITPEQATQWLIAQGFSSVDYLCEWQNRYVAAARLQGVRLLDNVPVL